MESDGNSTDEGTKRKRDLDLEKDEEPFGKSKKTVRTPSKLPKNTEDKMDMLLKEVLAIKTKVDQIGELKYEMKQMRVEQQQYIEEVQMLRKENIELKEECENRKRENIEMKKELKDIKISMERMEKEKKRKECDPNRYRNRYK